MANKILIITCKNDTHPNSVIEILNKENIPYFRLNTEALMTEYEFGWFHQSGSKPSFFIKDKNTDETILGNEVYSIWYRRPVLPEDLPYYSCENKEINKHNLEEAKAFYQYLMLFLSDYYSIGNHNHDRFANSKMVQSFYADKVGLKISPTCYANTKKSIVNFTSKYDELIIKPLRNYNVSFSEGYSYELYANKIDSSLLQEQPEEAFSQTVCFLQEYVKKAYEVRITIMGSHLFACKIDSQKQDDDKGKIDFRQGYDHNLHHEMISLPKSIEEKCRQYLRLLHLNFGCFDFVVTPEGEYVFLECNPNGQWGWIEDECGVPMSEAMIDCLINCRKV